jgi:hypothetical protein
MGVPGCSERRMLLRMGMDVSRVLNLGGYDVNGRQMLITRD